MRGERNRTRSREPRGERGEDAEVGVNLDTFDLTPRLQAAVGL